MSASLLSFGSTNMDNYRSVLEVLKFASVSAIPQVSAVSRLWSRCSEAEELYHQLCEDEEVDYEALRGLFSSKAALQVHHQNLRSVVSVNESRLRVFQCSHGHLINKAVYRPGDFPAVVERYQGRILTSISSHVYLPDGSLLYISLKAFLLQPSGQLIQTESLNTKHHRAGCIYYRQAVYIFGGLGSRSCERLTVFPLTSLPTRKWLELPDMNSTHFFTNPFRYKDQIYLFSRYVAGEVFSCTTLQWRNLQWSLPGLNLFEKSLIPPMIQSGKLVIFHSEALLSPFIPTLLTRWNFDNLEKVSEERLIHSAKIKDIWDYKVVVTSREIYWMSPTDSFVKLNLSTMGFESGEFRDIWLPSPQNSR